VFASCVYGLGKRLSERTRERASVTCRPQPVRIHVNASKLVASNQETIPYMSLCSSMSTGNWDLFLGPLEWARAETVVEMTRGVIVKGVSRGCQG